MRSSFLPKNLQNPLFFVKKLVMIRLLSKFFFPEGEHNHEIRSAGAGCRSGKAH